MNKLIIDRFEGSFAVCEREDKTMVTIPKDKLPNNCKEGDYLIINPDGTYQVDSAATLERKKRIRDKMNRLFEK
jgi:hypothetical protein